MSGNPSRRFPIQTAFGHGNKPAAHPLSVAWCVAEKAYSVYVGRFGRSQSLETLAERGGFSAGEMDMFYPEWRDAESEYQRGWRDGARAQMERDARIACHFDTPVDGSAWGPVERDDVHGFVHRLIAQPSEFLVCASRGIREAHIDEELVDKGMAIVRQLLDEAREGKL